MSRIITTDDRPVSFTFEASSPAQRVEPVTLEFTKAHLRFPSSAEDLLIAGAISAARAYFEEQTGRQTIDAVYEYALDATPASRVLELPRPPLADVVGVYYDDSTGTEQTLDPTMYRVLPSFLPPLVASPADDNEVAIDPYCACGRLELVSGASWPTTCGERCLRVRRTCGYGDRVELMPPLIQSTLLLLIAHFHTNRLEVGAEQKYQLPLGATTLLQGFKWTALPTRPPRTV